MMGTIALLVLAAILGSPGGVALALASPAELDAKAAMSVATSAPVDDDRAIVLQTDHVDLRADAIRLHIGDATLSPGSGDVRVHEWSPGGGRLETRLRWQEGGANHELYLGFEQSGERWAISDASYLQGSPGVRLPGAPASPIEFSIFDDVDGSDPEAPDGASIRATATVPVYACVGAPGASADATGASADAVLEVDSAEAVLEVDGLSLSVSPPRQDLLDIARALLGRGPRPPGDWLGQGGYTGRPVSVACPPPIAATLEDETVDLARTDDPDATTIASLVTEEVSPGVWRVSSDGVRDLRSQPAVSCESLASSVEHPGMGWEPPIAVDGLSRGRVVAGLDGGIWLFWGDRFLRLGDETTHRWTDGQVPTDGDDLLVAADGTIWQAPAWGSGAARSSETQTWAQARLEDLRAFPDAFAARPECLDDTRWLTEPDGVLRAYRDGQWQVALAAPSEAVRQVEVASDDSIWASWSESSTGGRNVPRVGRLGADGWRLATPPDEPVDPPRALEALDDGSLIAQARGRTVALWRLGGMPGPDPDRWQPLASRRGLSEVVASPSGIVWGRVGANSIARLDDDGWLEWDLGQATDPRFPRFIGGGGPLAVGQDGSLWLRARPSRAAHGCQGIYRFDGTSWSHFLDGLCVHSMDAAPNGWVWLRAAPDTDQGEGPVDLYAISPDALGS